MFRSEDTGYTVAKLNDKDQGIITICGNCPPLAEGVSIRGTGEWKTHARFGRQIQFGSLTVEKPDTKEGILRYLGSGLIDGVGPELARRLYREFGSKTLEVIRTDPGKLAKIRGIGKKRAGALSKSAQEAAEVETIMTWLLSKNIQTSIAFKIYKTYEDKAMEVLESNPWILADEVYGIGFPTADGIAVHMGLKGSHPDRVKAAVKYALAQAETQGHTGMYLPQLISKTSELINVGQPDVIAAAVQSLIKSKDYVVNPRGTEDNFVQSARMAYMESQMAKALVHLLKAPVSWKREDVEAVLPEIEQDMGITLSEDQRRAVFQLLTQRVGVLVGKPGCGKSTIVKAILGVMARLSPGTIIRLAAPTGKAAQRLAESTDRAASTMHRLLAWGPQGPGFNKKNPLDGDVFGLDEASMIDIRLGYNFVTALPQDGILLFVGDQYQLPSVGPGRVLADLQESGRIPVARLEQIHRQAKNSLIISNAHAIHEGNLAEVRQGHDFTIYLGDESKHLLAALEKTVLKDLPDAGFAPEDIQILTGGHRGLCGTKDLNRHLQHLLNPTPLAHLKYGEIQYGVGDRILITRNDYDLEVFNGQTGVVIDIINNSLIADIEGVPKQIGRDNLKDITHAYAITVHKSQGAQWPAVVMICDSAHYTLLERNWLYTGVTRSQKHCTLIVMEKAIRRAIGNVSSRQRLTRLRDEIIMA